MLDEDTIASFDRIYATDLVYSRDCWKLCGDAHCCSFTRYKSRFRMIGHAFRQELPMLPGEFEYLQYRGWLGQFEEFEHRVVQYPLSLGTMRCEFVCTRHKLCACNHQTRTTVCRLYPLLPMFDVQGRVIGVDQDFGIFEEIEQLDGLERACKLTAIPFAEMDKFLAIVNEIARRPIAIFFVMAYRLAKQQAREQLAAAKLASQRSAMDMLEPAFLLRRLLDHAALRPKIEALAQEFRLVWGARFALE